MNEDPERLAAERTALHRGQASQRILTLNHDLKGVAGEKALADFFGTTVKQLHHSGGDDHKDQLIWFHVEYGPRLLKVDVKCSERPLHLLVPVNDITDPDRSADIYILAAYQPKTRSAILLGWQWRNFILRYGREWIGDGGVVNLALASGVDRRGNELRYMAELKARFIKVEEPINQGGTQ